VAELGHEDEAWRKGLDGVLVVIFREQTLERWHVQGEIPCGLDDLVRNICLQGDPPKAVVTVSLELFEYEETWYRAVKMVSEACGVRFQRILAMLWSEGDTDRVRDRQDELRDRVRARGGDGGVAALEPLVCPRCRATWDHGSTCPTCDVPLVGASVVDVYEGPPPDRQGLRILHTDTALVMTVSPPCSATRSTSWSRARSSAPVRRGASRSAASPCRLAPTGERSRAGPSGRRSDRFVVDGGMLTA
jgi:hypothetical protein